MKNSRICFQIHKAKTKGLEEQTVDNVIDMEDFKDKTEEAFRLLIKRQKLELLKSLKIPGLKKLDIYSLSFFYSVKAVKLGTYCTCIGR